MARIRVRQRTIHSIEFGDGLAFEVIHRPNEAIEPVIRVLSDGRTVIGYAADASDDPHDPREDDNLGVMICWHRRYKLGDMHSYRNPEALWADLLGSEYEQLETAHDAAIEAWRLASKVSCSEQRYLDCCDEAARDLRQKVQDALKARGCTILPLHLLNHSGLAMSTGSFRHLDPGSWDSGQVGWIYAGPDEIERVGCPKDRVEAGLRAEVEEYDHYLRGECYGVCVEIFGKDGRRIDEDSCWGLLGQAAAEKELKAWIEAETTHAC